MPQKILRAILFLLIISLYLPLLLVLFRGLAPQNFLALFATKFYINMLFFTIFQAGVSTLAALLLGFPLAYILSNYNFFGKGLIKFLTLVPFVIPSILLILGFIIVWGNNGLINRWISTGIDTFSSLSGLDINYSKPLLKILYSFPAIILAHAFYNFGICARIIASRWANLPHNQVLAAKNLGANRWHIIRHIILPYLAPAIKTSIALVYLFCFTSFAIVLILGGGPWYSTLEIAIYKLVNIDFNLGEAASLSLVQMFSTLLIFSLFIRRGSRTNSMGLSKHLPKLSQSRGRFLMRIYLVLLSVFMILPFLAIIVLSFFSKYSLAGEPVFSIFALADFFSQIYNRKSIMLSLGLSTSASALALGISLAMAMLFLRSRSSWQRNILQIILFLPYFVSPIVLSLSYVYLKQFLGGESLFVLIIVLSLLSVPLLTRIILGGLSGISSNVVRAAENLGASTSFVFRTIYVPLVFPVILIGTSLTLCLSLGEISASIMLLPQGKRTVPLLIYDLLGRYRFFEATRAGLVLILSTILLLSIVEMVGILFKRKYSFDSLF